MTHKRVHKNPILKSQKSEHLTYKIYPFIYANTRFLQRSFRFYGVLTMYQKSSSSKSSRSSRKGN